jgi:uncharacterized protein involved in outer membrane biogenesis
MASRHIPRIIRIGVLGAGGLLAALLVLALLLPYLLDTNAVKQTLTKRVSQATGLEVVIGGDLHFSMLPALRVTADAVRLGIDGNDLAFAQQLVLGIDLLPLLRKEAIINSIIVQEPFITLARNADGEFVFSRPQTRSGGSTSLQLQHFAVVKGTVHYSDARSGSEFTALECSIEADSVLLAAGGVAQMFANTDLDTKLSCAELRHNAFKLEDLTVTVLGKQDVLILDPINMTLFGAAGTASLHTDFSSTLPQHSVSLALPQFLIEDFLSDLGAPQSAQGSMDFNAMLTMQGSTLESLSQTMSGQFALHGEQLVVLGVDIDDEISRYETSQNFSLVDMGAFFFAGPLGLMVTKGYDFVNVLQGSGTRSEVQTLVSEWTVTDGVALAQDVAMSTPNNRLALQGGLDFHQGQFVDVTFALVDAKGCPKLEQVINGSFRNPEVEQPGILKALAGPVLSLLKQGLDLVQEDDCEPFYTGSVPAP